MVVKIHKKEIPGDIEEAAIGLVQAAVGTSATAKAVRGILLHPCGRRQLAEDLQPQQQPCRRIGLRLWQTCVRPQLQ